MMSEAALAVADRAEMPSVACRDCNLFQLCLPVGGGTADLALLERIVKRRAFLRRGEHLFRPGDPFLFIYAVKFGSLKAYAPLRGGREQVTGFHLPGELLGLDAVDAEVHPSGARALETTSVCEIPLNRLEELGGIVTSVQRQLLRIMSRQLLHEQRLQAMLCKKGAEERLAAFLVSVSARLRQRGFSAAEFRLSMTRADIGDYLGIAKETVSRLFTQFQKEGFLSVVHRHVRLHDPARLAALAGVIRFDE